MNAPKTMRIGWYVEIHNVEKAYDDMRHTCCDTGCISHGIKIDTEQHYCGNCGSFLRMCQFLQDHTKSFMDFIDHTNMQRHRGVTHLIDDYKLRAPTELQGDRLILVDTTTELEINHNGLAEGPLESCDIEELQCESSGAFKDKHHIMIDELRHFFQSDKVRVKHGVFFTYD